jgi:hypothetical protein
MREIAEEVKADVLKILNKNPVGMTTEEISNELQHNRITICKYLACMEATGDIVMRKVGSAKVWSRRGKNGKKK